MSENKEFRMVEGVRKIHVAQYNANTGVYSKPVRVRGLAEVKVTRTFKEGSALGDMETMLTKKKLKQLDVTITANELPMEVEALLEGKTFANGELYSTTDDNQNPIAILYEEVWSDGSTTYNAIYNVKLARDGREGKGNSDNIDFQTISLSGTGLYSETAKAFDLVIDDRAEDVDKDKIKYFYDVVQYPSVSANIPTLDVVYTGYTSGEVTDISLDGVVFDKDANKFVGVPVNKDSFTFKLDGQEVTATKGVDGTFTFA